MAVIAAAYRAIRPEDGLLWAIASAIAVYVAVTVPTWWKRRRRTGS